MAYITPEELLAQYAAGERDFSGIEFENFEETLLTGVDLSGIALSECDLGFFNFFRTNFSRANLEEVNLEAVDLRKANLTGANLRGAYIEGADMVGAIFNAADLTGIHGGEASIFDSSGIDANFTNAKLWQCSFDRANLTGANFTNAVLEGASFDDVNLTGANLSDAIGFYYRRALFSNTTMPDGSIRSDRMKNP